MSSLQNLTLEELQDLRERKMQAMVTPEVPSPKGRTLLDQSLQGGTFGFSDEIMDAVAATGAKGYDKINALLGNKELYAGRSIGDIYDEARGASQERLSRQVRTRPGLSVGSNLAGALVTGGIGASTKAGKALGTSLRAGG